LGAPTLCPRRAAQIRIAHWRARLISQRRLWILIGASSERRSKISTTGQLIKKTNEKMSQFRVLEDNLRGVGDENARHMNVKGGKPTHLAVNNEAKKPQRVALADISRQNVAQPRSKHHANSPVSCSDTGYGSTRSNTGSNIEVHPIDSLL